MKIYLYFLCMLKSSEWNPVFFSPSLTVTREDGDGGKVIRFGDSDATDERERPRNQIFVPPLAYEECPKHAYVCFDDAHVDAGNPRYLTVEQYKEASKADTVEPVSTPDTIPATA